MLVGKRNLSVEKKCRLENLPCKKTEMSGMSGIPWNARPKNGRGGKKPPGGEKKEKKFVICKKKYRLGGKNVGWKR